MHVTAPRLADLPPVPRHTGVTRARFEAEIVPAGQPAVLAGLVDDWPAVQAARQSAEGFLQLLARHASDAPVDALLLKPEEQGRVFYDASMAGFNFLRNRLPLAQVLEQVWRYAQFPVAPAVAVQSALLSECIPGFAAAHANPLLDEAVAPRLWVGSAIVTPAHFDESANIACVLAGRRRFTLLPPAQVDNLYVGPLDHAPTGTPLSLVDFRQPDLARHPRFAQALAAASQAELAPGDALYIPPLWWHHVESLARINGLVNYWWRPRAEGHAPAPSALDALLHAVLSLRALPAAERAHWRSFFEHWVFDAGRDVAGHIPPAQRGALGTLTPELQDQLQRFLGSRLPR